MYSNEGSMSTWGVFLFLLILFAVFGGNRVAAACSAAGAATAAAV